MMSLKPEQTLEFHSQRYLKALRKEKSRGTAPYQFIQLQDYFRHNKIKIVKLNHCLTTEGTTQFDGYMQLNEDGDGMEIYKKVPMKKMFVKSADDNYIHGEKMRIK